MARRKCRGLIACMAIGWFEPISREHGTERGLRDTGSNKTAPRPAPVAPRRAHSFTAHGLTVSDDYAWLKDANWQDVLRDPSILNADIRNYLEAENAYTDDLLGHTAPLQRTLVAEMRGRIKEDDFSVPAPDGPFAYLRKFRDGGQHEMFGRTPRDGGKTEIILDGDQLAAAHDYFKFGGARHSPDHGLEAWSADIKGSEYFSVRVRDWAGGSDRDDLVEETDGTVVWSADCGPSSMQARRQSPPDAGLAPPPRHAAGG